MFDVPLNDARSYQGPDLADGDALTSATCYTEAPSAPAKPSKKSYKKSRSAQQVKVGNLTEDDEYSFDVDL